MVQGAADRTFRVLFVCTGNICRSPFAEMLTRHVTARSGGFVEVASAGVAAVVGSAMHPASRAALPCFGVPESAAASFRARQLTAPELAAADLVLGLAPEHRSEALRIWPPALATAFTVREFARLVGLVDFHGLPADPVARARAVVQAARACRGITPCSPADDTVPDPIRGSAADHLNSARICAEALHTTLAALTPGVGAALRPTAGFATD
jgi:protein-tyrosine phosphatase